MQLKFSQAFDYELKETPDSHWMYVLMEKGDMDLHQVNNVEIYVNCALILIFLDFDNKQTGGHTDTIQTEVLLGANVTGCEVNCPFR